ncbi:MAG: Sapep family Mn(2+)-dependent dipeptidase [Clostridiales bacterium]|nr:Sapep family Mn(2+)-dependent dipeptidase [Clostridiales bacterium]
MNRQELVRQLDAYIDSHRAKILEDWKSLVRIPSVSVEGTEEKPFGEACARILDHALAMADQRGFAVNNHGNWYGTAFLESRKEGEGIIGIFSHLDVVEPGEGWTYDPFEPLEKDGFLIGRGAGDNKSGVIIGLYTMQAIKELGIPLGSNLMLYFGCNEEAGMKDAERFAKEHVMPDYSMVPDLFFPVCYGEKGSLRLTLQSTSGFSQITGFSAGKAENMIPASASAEIAFSRPLYEEAVRLAEGRTDIEVLEKSNKIVITSAGVGGHSAMPAGSVNGIWLLVDFLKDLTALAESDRKICAALADFSGDSDGSALGIAWEDEPSGKLVCAATVARMDGSIPEALFSIRYPVTDYRERIETELLRVIGSRGFAVKHIVNNDPMYMEKDEPYIRRLMKVYHEVTGKPNEPYVIDGGTYARKLKHAVGYGGGNGVRAPFLPKGHGGVHQPDEARSIDGVLEAIRIYVLSAMEIDAMIQEERKEKGQRKNESRDGDCRGEVRQNGRNWNED